MDDVRNGDQFGGSIEDSDYWREIEAMNASRRDRLGRSPHERPERTVSPDAPSPDAQRAGMQRPIDRLAGLRSAETPPPFRPNDYPANIDAGRAHVPRPDPFAQARRDREAGGAANEGMWSAERGWHNVPAGTAPPFNPSGAGRQLGEPLTDFGPEDLDRAPSPFQVVGRTSVDDQGRFPRGHYGDDRDFDPAYTFWDGPLANDPEWDPEPAGEEAPSMTDEDADASHYEASEEWTNFIRSERRRRP